MQTIAEALRKLQSSKFRSSFHLSESDIDYVDKKGMSVIRSHAEDFHQAASLACRDSERRTSDTDARSPGICGSARLCMLLPRLPLQMVQN